MPQSPRVRNGARTVRGDVSQVGEDPRGGNHDAGEDGNGAGGARDVRNDPGVSSLPHGQLRIRNGEGGVFVGLSLLADHDASAGVARLREAWTTVVFRV